MNALNSRLLPVLFATFALALPASAATVSLTGVFSSDDDVAFGFFQISTARTIQITSFGYGGGHNAAGTLIAPGGFDPFLSLFEASGSQNLLALNDDGGCSTVAADSVSGACLDPYLSIALAAGSYRVALTQSGNSPLGPTFADGFLMDGAGNFTGGPFLDALGYQRNGNWAFDIAGLDPVPTPEPATGALLLAGLALACRLRATHN